MGQFQPGQSGNPSGRPKGSKNRSTKLLDALGDDVPELLEATKRAALDGDMTAMRLLMDRALPVSKATAPPVELPELQKAETLTQKADAIMAATGKGEIPPDVASQLIAALGNVAKLAEIDEIERRLQALEEGQP